MTKFFNSLEEIQPYYRAEINTYVFEDKCGNYLNVKLKFELRVESSIDAMNIYARNIYARKIDARDIIAQNINAERIDAQLIDAWDINAWDINARKINAGKIDAWDICAWDIYARRIDAWNISYYAVCIAYELLKCKSIKGRQKNALHKCLDEEIKYIQ